MQCHIHQVVYVYGLLARRYTQYEYIDKITCVQY